jgi:hypothetical protein
VTRIMDFWEIRGIVFEFGFFSKGVSVLDRPWNL